MAKNIEDRADRISETVKSSQSSEGPKAIDKAMISLHDAKLELESVTNTLMVRLDSILSDEPDTVGGTSVKKEPVKLSEIIYYEADDIRESIYKLRNILEKLQI